MRKIFYYLLFFTSNLSAQEWKYLGLSSESITTISIDWSDSSIIYAGSRSDFSAGSVGGVFKSTNGGGTWDTLIRGVTAREIVIHPTNPQIVYATLGINMLTKAGVIKTTDRGLNWAKADSGIYMSPEVGPGPLVIDPNHSDTLYCGTAGNFGGRFYRSTNGGMSWKYFRDSINYLGDGVVSLAIHPESTNIVYAGTAGSGCILRSTDYGETWSLLKLTNGAIVSIQFGNVPSTIYVGSSHTKLPVTLLKTTDEGLTWSNPKLGLPDTANIDGIQILKETPVERVFCIANWRDAGGIYESRQGEQWEKIGIDTGRVTTIKLFHGKLYAGYGGVFVRDMLTSAVDNSSLPPRNFNLYGNFPNPFNPVTKITYETTERGEVLLEIFDTQGKKIKTLVRERQLPSKYSVTWNAQNDQGIRVSSGVYVYVLRTQGNVAARKMIYLK